MGKFYIELGIYRPKNDKEWEFNKEATIIADLYSKYLSNFKIKNLNKIGIYLVQKEEDEYIQANSNLNKVCAIIKKYDFDNFINKTGKIRAKEILDILQSNVILLANEFDWNTDPFNEAFKRIIE